MSMQACARDLVLIAEPTRLRLLRLLGRQELCVCELMDALRMPQYRISRHLRTLRTLGLVEARREGRWIHYRAGRGLIGAGVLAGVVKAMMKGLDATPEARRDDARLARRLTLREGNRCVVGPVRRRSPSGRC
jgi:ArsR family transcriptional regulator